ncbi:MAG: XRE family transcriptional regulator [Christensenellaceae bacterium]|nr:XRE family transcriptional regulator [Christensenellaceae bacterium]
MDLGEKIRRLRLVHGLTQEELAQRCDLSKGFISQLERDLTSPSIATLMDILECLGQSLKSFFSEDMEEEKIVFGEDDIYDTKDPEKGTRIAWLIPNAQKNEMEPILIELQPGSSSTLDNPHEGEEFGYVLSGGVVIELGGKTHRAKRGESFYFRPSSPHRLRNPGKQVAKILWVCTPPSF